MKTQEAGIRESLKLDCEQEVQRITSWMRTCVVQRFRKRGLVLGLSGGIDSSVVGALAVLAMGKDNVLGLSMPEREASAETPGLSSFVAEHLGVRLCTVDITSILETVGCYSCRDEAIRSVIPEYEPGWRSKIVLPDVRSHKGLRMFHVVVESPDGQLITARLPLEAYLKIVAATNFKQRARKMLEYHHADRLNYAVAGTPNRLEYDQGFFVKLGDGAADVKPIAHLYKCQVYQIGEFLGLPRKIIERPPTTDTYSLPQTQEEFYFSVPYQVLDHCLYAKDHELLPEQVAEEVDLPVEYVERIYRDIEDKRRAAAYQHAAPLLVP
jgi:NAD+ synthase